MISREDYLKLPIKERFLRLDKAEEERAEELHRKCVSIDLHSLIYFDEVTVSQGIKDSNITEHVFGEATRVPQIKNSGVTGFFQAIHGIPEDLPFHESMNLLGFLLYCTIKHPNFIPAFRAEDFRRAKNNDKQAVMFQLEAQSFGKNLDTIDIAFGLGIRMAMLTENSKNYVGDGCGERTNSGLSYYGLEMVEMMNKAGMIIDLSHVGVQSSLDAIDASKDPIMANHVGARALNPKCKRLKTDDELKALAESGGIAGVSAIPNFLSNEKKQGIDDVLNHIDYMVDLMGVDHVGIGLDNLFGDHVELVRRTTKTIVHPDRIGIEKLNAPYMYGIENPEEWFNVTRGLVSRSYSDLEIEKILGENSLKLMERVIG
ncbi:MAG: dipeptidase [Candidatus Hodarchaeales archaeon]|jgi:membrane dipeptidase